MDKVNKIDNRINSIDSFRGLIIISMVIVNFIKIIDWIPAWLKHASPGSVTFVDLIAPAFIFIIGMTYPLSFNKRKERFGKESAVQHTVYRSLSLIGIEILFYLYVQLIYKYKEQIVWNTLSIIGFAILVSLPFINTKSFVKLLIGVVLIMFHQLIPMNKFGFSIYKVGGGAYSLAGWSSIIFLSLFMSDLFFNSKKKFIKKGYIVAGFIFLIIGFFSGFKVPYVRDGMSFSLCFLSLGIISLVFYIIYILNDVIKLNLGFLGTWGKNPLLIYLISLAFVPFNIANREWSIFSKPNWGLLLYFICYLLLLQFIVIYLNNKNFRVRL